MRAGVGPWAVAAVDPLNISGPESAEAVSKPGMQTLCGYANTVCGGRGGGGRGQVTRGC